MSDEIESMILVGLPKLGWRFDTLSQSLTEGWRCQASKPASGNGINVFLVETTFGLTPRTAVVNMVEKLKGRDGHSKDMDAERFIRNNTRLEDLIDRLSFAFSGDQQELDL